MKGLFAVIFGFLAVACAIVAKYCWIAFTIKLAYDLFFVHVPFWTAAVYNVGAMILTIVISVIIMMLSGVIAAVLIED